MSLRDLVTMPLPTDYGAVSLPSPVPPALAQPMVDSAGNVYVSYPPSPAYPNGAAYPAAYGGDGQLYAMTPNGTIFKPVVAPVPKSGAPGWGRQHILPDSVLPPVLQRTNPLIPHYVFEPNGWDTTLRRESLAWGWIRAHGGIKSCCRVPDLGAPVYNNPPWLVQPSQGEKFEEMFAKPLTAFQDGMGNFTGADIVLGQFVVPNGYDGALNRVVAQFNGSGFQDFSGDIVWRVLINNRYARNLGNIKNTFGDFATAFSVPGSDNIRLVSQQTVTLIANIPALSPVTGGPVMAGAFGWFYPRR